MTRTVGQVAVTLGVALASACSAVTDFDLGRLAETSGALCGDGVDNDGDGLVDCQDFNCLDQAVCCSLPRLLLADDFEGEACAQESCAGRTGLVKEGECISRAQWKAWGTPYPFVCEGALVPRKGTQCFEIGVIGLVPLQLRPGLRVRFGIEGLLEPAGRLTVGLTQQREISGAADQCADLDPVEHVLGVTQTWTAAGAHLTARFDQRDLATSPPVGDSARHQVDIFVTADRRVSYLLDGEEFARSPADLPLPATPREVRVTLQGRSLSARFTDIRAFDESRCDTPGEWSQAAGFVALRWPDNDNQWDSFEVSDPAVLRPAAGVVELYYTGCLSISSACVPRSLGLGLAVSRGGAAFVRVTDANPLVVSEDIHPTGSSQHLESSLVDAPGETRYYLSAGAGIWAFQPSAQPSADGARLEALNGGAAVLGSGPAGSWDDAALCCATVVAGQDGVVRLWYAAQGSTDAHPVWRVGLAQSADGLAFEKSPDNPVLVEGPAEGFDGRGVTEPAVAYDQIRHMFRMWYGAYALFGNTSIGYAVSPDGVTWHKYPGNPVLTKEQVGLYDIGRPAVLADEGELRMWIHGREPGSTRRSIYEVQNLGREQGASP